MTVEVLGTEFIVGWSEEGTIQVDVIHGKVAVSSDGNKVILTDGDTFSHAPKAIPTAENTNPASEEPGMPVLKAEPASPRTTPSDITKKRTSVKKVPVKQSNPVQATKVETPLETDIPVVEADDAKKSDDAPVQTAEVVKIESQPVAPIQNKTKVEIERFKDPVQRSLAEIILEIRKGKLHRALGQLKAHQNAHAGHRNTMDAKYLEGYCLYKLGNKEQAMKIWEHYESRVPNGPWLRTVRDWTSPSVPSLDRLR